VPFRFTGTLDRVPVRLAGLEPDVAGAEAQVLAHRGQRLVAPVGDDPSAELLEARRPAGEASRRLVRQAHIAVTGGLADGWAGGPEARAAIRPGK
jgi:hypothetical protein